MKDTGDMKVPTDQMQTGSQIDCLTEAKAQTSALVTPGQRWSLHGILFCLARLILGGIFIFASLDKIMNPLAFAKSISNYQILPNALINLAAIVLPWLELILGTLLVFGVWLPGTIVLVDLLLVVFFGALMFNLVRGLNVDCGCFSTSPTENPSIILSVMRDTVFLFLGGYLFYGLFLKPLTPFDKQS
jgi:uncharacterized membrane protein YphA (DoxX/SURF4 family)